MSASGQQQTITPGEDGSTAIYARLLQELQNLRGELQAQEAEAADPLRLVEQRHRASALNLIHYLGLRRRDARPLQERLAAAGLSSLGRAESHVMSNLQAVIGLLQRVLGEPQPQSPFLPIRDAEAGAEVLEANARDLLGKAPAQRRGRILVTLPGEAADDYALVKAMLLHGMDCARINCAHDGPPAWQRMIEQIRHAQRETGRSCRILMDLAGPKLRTGAIAAAPAVLKWRPQRDVYGKVTVPARIWLYPEDSPCSCPAPADACLPVQGDWLKQADASDSIEFSDARGALRSLQLVGQVGDGYWAESRHTTYLRPDLELHLLRTPASGHPRRVGRPGLVGALPSAPQVIRLQRGDQLILTRAAEPGCPAQYDANGNLVRAASIACTLPEVFASLKPGERILFDDGRIGGVIRKVSRHELLVEITQARDDGEKLLADRGINLPDSSLELAGMTAQDIENLQFVARHADMVGLSFVRSAADIELLQQHLQRLDAGSLGVVLKIETRAAFELLPQLLLTLLRSPTVGVMIARGDLAVECGYERLAELQEEIMWLAEAAHLPVIWATQVLEGLAKNGKPSRAEISDAAMGERAECVMLNKGPHILEAIQTLDDILQRMQGHQQKKSALLRRLHW